MTVVTCTRLRGDTSVYEKICALGLVSFQILVELVGSGHMTALYRIRCGYAALV